MFLVSLGNDKRGNNVNLGTIRVIAVMLSIQKYATSKHGPFSYY